MQTAVELFENTLNWLQENYFNFRFFTERDVVWTLQTHLQQQIVESKLNYQVLMITRCCQVQIVIYLPIW